MKPVAAISAPPTLLARNPDSNPAAFRGEDAGSREPRATGSIESIADGIAAIDLGSLDGLAKDATNGASRHGKIANAIVGSANRGCRLLSAGVVGFHADSSWRE